MVHRGGPCGEEGWFGHPQFTAGSPHFQDPFPWIIATESPLLQRIVQFPPKNLALARLHPLGHDMSAFKLFLADHYLSTEKPEVAGAILEELRDEKDPRWL